MQDSIADPADLGEAGGRNDPVPDLTLI